MSWRKDAYEGSSALIGYTIEYYCSDLQTGWVVAAHRITSETYTVNNLKPDTSYIFIVRAENSHGISEPSIISEHVKTLKSQHFADYVNIEDARDSLLTKLIEIVDTRSTAHTIFHDNPSRPTLNEGSNYICTFVRPLARCQTSY